MTASDHMSTIGAAPPCDAAEAAHFLFSEAERLDEHDYEGWLALWDDDDGIYWVPACGDDSDPTRDVSFVYDNRSRLTMRIRQLLTGFRYAQIPQSRTQHYISNVRVSPLGEDAVEVRSAYLIVEARFDEVHHWPGRATHELTRAADGELRIRRKTVVFINNDQPVTSMAFLP
jgi:3-phenylpropionate/cinnamic acid dioxygenase small subunit